MPLSLSNSATEIAHLIKKGEISAVEITNFFLEKISRNNTRLNAFTTVLQTRAIKTADKIDQQIKQGENPGTLAGVPFAVKNFF